MPKSNLLSHFIKALNDLRKDESIVILPADKGSIKVVMDLTDYTEK